MSDYTAEEVREKVDAVYRSDSRRVLATLIRLLGDFDLAEEALVVVCHGALALPEHARAPREGSQPNCPLGGEGCEDGAAYERGVMMK